MKKLLKVNKRQRNKKIIFAIITIIMLFMSVNIFIYVDKKIKPTVQAIAEAKAQEMANRAINNAVGKMLRDKIKYEELINLKTDKDGNITMVQANTICTKTLKCKNILSLFVINNNVQFPAVPDYFFNNRVY